LLQHQNRIFCDLDFSRNFGVKPIVIFHSEKQKPLDFSLINFREVCEWHSYLSGEHCCLSRNRRLCAIGKFEVGSNIINISMGGPRLIINHGASVSSGGISKVLPIGANPDTDQIISFIYPRLENQMLKADNGSLAGNAPAGFVSLYNNELCLYCPSQYYPNSAADAQPQSKRTIAISPIDSSSGPNEKQSNSIRQTEQDIHFFSLHDVLRMELVGVLCGFVTGGFFGFLLGNRRRQ